MAWGDFLRIPARSDHAVQMYGDFGDLAESAAAYFAAGFERGDVGIAVARAENIAMICDRLGGSPPDLLTADAEGTLSLFMENGHPVRERFEETVGGLLDEAQSRRPGARVRAFGEMVDLLWERGEQEAAVELEELWNRLAERREFSLLCGYRFDVFDRQSLLEELPSLVAAHSHVRPVAKPGLLSQAVDGALQDSFGDREAARIYLAAADDADGKLPLAQAVLSWLTANQPRLAEPVLSASRLAYRRNASAVG